MKSNEIDWQRANKEIRKKPNTDSAIRKGWNEWQLDILYIQINIVNVQFSVISMNVIRMHRDKSETDKNRDNSTIRSQSLEF